MASMFRAKILRYLRICHQSKLEWNGTDRNGGGVGGCPAPKLEVVRVACLEDRFA